MRSRAVVSASRNLLDVAGRPAPCARCPRRPARRRRRGEDVPADVGLDCRPLPGVGTVDDALRGQAHQVEQPFAGEVEGGLESCSRSSLSAVTMVRATRLGPSAPLNSCGSRESAGLRASTFRPGTISEIERKPAWCAKASGRSLEHRAMAPDAISPETGPCSTQAVPARGASSSYVRRGALPMCRAVRVTSAVRRCTRRWRSQANARSRADRSTGRHGRPPLRGSHRADQ